MPNGSEQICPICKQVIASPMDAVGFPRSIELDTCRVPEMSDAVTHYNCVFGLMKFNDLVSDIIDFYKLLHPQRDRIKIADRNVIYYIKDQNDLRIILLNSYVRCSLPPDKAPDFVTDLQALYSGKPAGRTGLCSPSPSSASGAMTAASVGDAFVKRRSIYLHFAKDLTTLTPQGIRIQRLLDFVDVRALEKLLPEFRQMADSAKAMSAFKKQSTPAPPSAGTAPQAPRITRMVSRNIVSGASPLGQALQRIQRNLSEPVPAAGNPNAEPYLPPPLRRPGSSSISAAAAMPGAQVPAIPHPTHTPLPPSRPAAPQQPPPIPHPTAQIQHLTAVPEIPPPGAAGPQNQEHATPPHTPSFSRAFESQIGVAGKGRPGAAGSSGIRSAATHSGLNEPAAPPEPQSVTIGIVTVSDRASRGEYEDLGGPSVAAFLDEALTTPYTAMRAVIPDEHEQLRSVLVRMCDRDQCCLILTTGGTGPAERDITPEVTAEVCAKMLPGFGEEMRRVSLQYVPTAILSRQTAGIRGQTLIINLPGRPKSIRECLTAIFAAVPYCIDLIGGPTIDTNPSVIKAFRPERK